MTYSEFDDVLRFGDVLKGYLSTIPKINKPLFLGDYDDYQIEVNIHQFSVIMDPCCEIGNGTISLTPLIEIRYHWMDNPHIAENLLILNKVIKPLDAIHPRQWNSLLDERKMQLFDAEPRYQHTNYFIYDADEKLPVYEIAREYQYALIDDDETGLPRFQRNDVSITHSIRHYMIEFKNIFHLKCDKIIKDRLEEEINASKILQLSIHDRTDLRRKLAFYYITSPDEEI